MSPLKNSIATKALALLVLLCWTGLALAAQVVGSITNLSGPLMAKKADGVVKVLALRSEVEQGDTLVSEKNTYAQVKFIDNSEITLRPNSSFKVDNFSFDAGKPDGDNASFTLVKGGLRSVTGLLGKRNKEKFALKTPSATIGIRGTTFIVEWVEPTPEAVAMLTAWREASTASSDLMALAGAVPLQLAQNTAPQGPNVGLAPGLYVHVIDGIINLSNKGGSQTFSAGQFGFTPTPIQPPVLVPKNPGILFTPPQAFQSSSGSKTGTSSAAKAVDCEVR
ncbi:MAG: FecR family protein [Pseudomonadota bacterium]